ncbi:dual 3',5'-cyclic-AMP and -GMP phosphodiesterase 11A-like [Stylophora pistillata]|uniref:Phosphodiesterase n=1 Tax=Stylophora pistillata TaxID=50429 RepID=A0A2B4S9Z2_STYPI|nr:dual 3',5'-cyclic-AMP and -GMP phosphodiesterase 11A-like [Stylophora pistillata]PFX27484.1 Dual 3',5'-cyclic-AMP and -GMP phosphodiesterase 11A [Stylophora pistillata]
MTLSFTQVEQWLDDHPEHAEEYFVRKGTARMVQLWNEAREECADLFDTNVELIENCSRRKIGEKNFRFNDTVDIINASEEGESEAGQPTSRSSPLTRRYSEPQRQGNPKRQLGLGYGGKLFFTKPVSSSVVDSLDLSTCEIREEKTKRVRSPPSRQLRKTKSLPNCGQQHVLGALIESKIRLPSPIGLNAETKLDLKNNNERQFFFEIVRDIANDLDLTTLSYKILVNVGILTNADRCSLFLVEGPKGKQSLVSKVFDVQVGGPNSTSIKDFIDQQKEIRVPWGKGLVGYAAETGETVNIPDAYADPRFNKEVDRQTGYHTKSLFCKPVKNNEGEVVGVAQIINKMPGPVPFTQEDEEVCEMYLTFCGIGITNAKLFELSVKEFNRNRALLELVHDIFEDQTSLDKVVHKIMRRALSMLKCERCSVLLLVHPVLGNSLAEERSQDLRITKVFNLRVSGGRNSNSTIYSEGRDDGSFSTRIAKLVASTGKTLNVPDAAQDQRLKRIIAMSSDNGVDARRPILCMPIRNNKFEIIGVAQLISKLNNKPFDESDETLFEAFAIFCGLGIHNTMIYDQMAKAKAKQQVAIEVLSYHAAAKRGEIERLKNTPVSKAEEFKVDSFQFDDFSLEPDQMLQASLRMFIDCGFIDEFHIDYEILCRWLLTVRKNYRNVIYHNWRHAFNVAQSMFCMLTTGGMNKFMSNLECLGLIVGCLCHDLDHRGTNNAFQTKTDSPLAKLYTTSTLEHHHFNHAVIILSTEGHNIFQKLNADEYRQVISYIKHSILSTDLAVNFRQRSILFPLVERGELDPKIPDHRDMLKAMMMTACDLNGTTKPWEIQKEVVHLVTSEFFQQGDLERNTLKMEPSALMDRQKVDELPALQVQFFETTGIPVFKCLATFNPNIRPLLDGAESNKNRWCELEKERQARQKEEENKHQPIT